MQFSIRDPQEDVLCITVYDRDLFTPNGNLLISLFQLKRALTEKSLASIDLILVNWT